MLIHFPPTVVSHLPELLRLAKNKIVAARLCRPAFKGGLIFLVTAHREKNVGVEPRLITLIGVHPTAGPSPEEASLLDFPAVTIRDMPERPEGMNAGTLVMSGLNRSALLQVMRDGYGRSRRFTGEVADYRLLNISTKIVRIVFSYIDHVIRIVWSKDHIAFERRP